VPVQRWCRRCLPQQRGCDRIAARQQRVPSSGTFGRKQPRTADCRGSVARKQAVPNVLDQTIEKDFGQLLQTAMECGLAFVAAEHDRPLTRIDRADAVEHAFAVARGTGTVRR
jgi:hypothetical protein